MPHDPMPADLALDAGSLPWASPKTKSNSLRSAMKAAGRALVGSAKLTSGRAILASAMAVAALLGASSRKAEGQQYTYQNLTLPGGVAFEPTGINNQGQIVGNLGGTSGAVLFNQTTNTYQTLNYPGASQTFATGVNDNGEVSGYYLNSGSNIEQGFMYSNGSYTSVSYPNSNGTAVHGINNAGNFVGIELDPTTNLYMGFSFQGSFSELPAYPQGFWDSAPNAINNNNVIAGNLYPNNTITTMNCAYVGNGCGFTLSGSTYTVIEGPGTEGAQVVQATSINDSGQVVGDYEVASGDPYLGFVLNGTTYTTILPPSCTTPFVQGINNAGTIVGYCEGGSTLGFMATPPVQTYSVPPKTLGDCGCDGSPSSTGGAGVGYPINVATGNMFERATDYATAGPNPLSFTRSYNSLQGTSNAGTFAVALGTNWRSNYDRYLNVSSGTVTAERPDGQVLTFTSNGSGGWTSDSDVDYTLTQNGAAWTLTGPDDTVESYAVTGTKGTLQTIALRDGYTQTLHYNASSQLSSVTDSYSRSLGFTYNGALLNTLTTPDGLTMTYGFTPAGGSNVLTSVAYNTAPATNITYQYTDAAFPFALTGIVDEKGQQFATWTYDSQGRGQTSQHGTGASTANLTTVAYNANGTTTVTNAFGVADTYTFQTLQGVPKVTQISRAATSTTAAATENFGYDANGYVNSRTDWNANQTTLVNNTHGDPTTINFAVGSTVAFTETIQYDPTFVHLPHIVTLPGVTSTYVRDGSGNPLNRTDVDTTTQNTQGQSRETQWTWTGTGQMQSVQLPRTDVTAKTTFGYTGGTLTSITDALTHQTKITQYTGGGLPLTVVDPNNVTTTLAYDGRLNLHTSTVATTAGNLVTTWTWDPANELQSVQQPDGSQLTYGYDTAHRRITTADLPGNTTTATLDALGGATLVNVTNPSNTVTLTHSAVFDALDRVTSDIGGVGQTTKYAYDPMGNVLTITPPAPGGVITQTPDALNRLATRTDPAPGGMTSFTYDPFNRPLTVKDANSNTTSYAYSGFGDRLQTVSPDSGTTTFTYDPDSNLTKSVLPGSLTMNATFDADDRPLTNTYTGDATLSVSRTYDQSGHGFGIGRLTSATDQAGSLSRSYDERGNVTQETRTPAGLAALVTSTAYDAAGNVASFTYPDGNLVTYARNTMGQVTAVTSKPSGASSATNIATNITYEPLPEFTASGAPPVTALTFGNGLTGTYHYNKDYLPTTRVDKSATTTFENLTYTYFANRSVHTITDAVTASNTQTLNVNAVDEVSSATSGTGGYGTLSFTWDPVGNIKTEIANGTVTTYHLAAGSNRMSGFVTGSTTENIASSPTGNMTTFKVGTTTLQTLAYNKANQLASSTTPGATASYEYDLNGERLEKTGSATGTTVFQYAAAEAAGRGNLLLTENNGTADRVDYIYLNPGPGANIPVGAYQPSNNAFYFISTDRLGTPVAATDSTKTVQWSATYLPFGYTATGASGIVQNLRLPGQETDLESTLNHNGYRDYATTLTRYVESDPIGLAGGMNTYQYVGGNPYKSIDPKGLFQFTFTVCDEGLCVTGTAGVNTGQLNYGGYVGVGSGTSFNFDPNDSGCKKTGTITGFQADTQVASPFGQNVHFTGTAGSYQDQSQYSSYQFSLSLPPLPFAITPINFENGQIQPPPRWPTIGLGDSSTLSYGARTYLSWELK